MRWSWRVARVAGISIHLHATLLILLAWVGYRYYAWRHHMGDMIEGVLFIAAFFVIVLLHELGHALAARHYGVPTRDITLLPIGGVARIERIPENPRQELVIALAGPAVNVLIAVIYWGAVSPISAIVHPRDLQLVGGDFLEKLVWGNVAMGVFNLAPAFPMDGGRVLRAVLAWRLGHTRATRIAVDIGQALAFALGAIGLYAMNPIYVFVALFVYLGAEDEGEIARVQSALSGIPVERIMIREFRSLAPSDALERAVEHILAGCHQDFPVIEGERVVGVLTRKDLVTALAKRGPQAPVAEVMRRDFHTARPGDTADRAFARLDQGDCRSMPVLDGDRLLGVLTAENVGEFLVIHSALKRQGRV